MAFGGQRQARRQIPRLPISFTSPNIHPETDTPGDAPTAPVATTHHHWDAPE